MRDNIDTRDGQIERILHRQGTRFTTMLAVAIFLSIAALVAVGVIGYLMLNQPGDVLIARRNVTGRLAKRSSPRLHRRCTSFTSLASRIVRDRVAGSRR